MNWLILRWISFTRSSKTYQVVFIGRGFRVTTWISGHADGEVLWIDGLDVANKVAGIPERSLFESGSTFEVGGVSSKGKNVSHAQLLGLVKVRRYRLRFASKASHVKHGLDTEVVDGRVGNHGRRGFRIAWRVTRRVPRHIHEEWTTHSHTLHSRNQIDRSGLGSRGEEFEREKLVFWFDPSVNFINVKRANFSYEFFDKSKT